MKILTAPFMGDSYEMKEKVFSSLKEISLNSSNRFVNFGNVVFDEYTLSGDLSRDEGVVYKKTFEVINEISLILTRNHELNYPITRGFFDNIQNQGKEPCLIVFDSCSHLLDSEKEKGWLWRLIDDGFKKENILLVGQRDFSWSELEFISGRIRRVNMEQLMFDLEHMTSAIMEFGSSRPLFVIMDMSVIEPGNAPGVDKISPGGISSKDFLYICKRLSKVKSFQGLNLTGINISRDLNNITSSLGAKILSEFI